MIRAKRLQKKSDERGWLVEIFKAETTGITDFGLVFVTTAFPGFIKGNHYHEHKREWLCALQGRGKLVLENVSSKEREEMEIGEESLLVIEIPPGTAHGFKNMGDTLLMVIEYADKEFDMQKPDTYSYKVVE